ncbi:hypothetical protein [Leptospira noguchii]|uniref:Lipoprotein n=2 Tax=Leptospira noguchii TaxID=28182 RepID=M6U8Z0_9LEPT|nr:hypothetical protein [Leptospira noguchii]EMO26046.1 hypothetical protein LEP1GSC170_2911 [Leptospira interrogans serovar Bataviae str. HAI135]EKR72041.1 hypothetical protein LEP1GSC041_1002 [Leptospira noguchii str. 2006001870]EMO40970.1 hypothetical protein LEP1GSC186_4400 [Leptospira noguchii serovar Autumnalis str. ZUN142]EMS83745.1 hypothetical protein LEP1GSC074_0840 [Leptospira noguchii str. Hook]EMS86094.1 hypothetical protein LEP1GSC073_3971 [Leptospira noguchii str. Cascata]
MKNVFALAGTALLFLIPGLLVGQLAGPPDEEKAKKDIQTYWLKKNIGDKIQSIESNGEPVLIENSKSNSDILYKFPFLVTVKRKDGSVTRTEVGVNYVFIRTKGWLFSELGFGKNIILSNPGKESLDKEVVLKLIEESLLQDRWKGKTIENLKISESTSGIDLETHWYLYSGEYVVVDFNARYTCSNLTVKLFKEDSSATDWKLDWKEKGICRQIYGNSTETSP